MHLPYRQLPLPNSNSNFIQLCLHPTVYHTLLCLSLLHTRNLTFPFTTVFCDPPPRLPFLNRYLHISTDIHVHIPLFQMLSLQTHLPSLSLSTSSPPPQHSYHVPIPGTIALLSTIPRYILPTPPSYYYAACLLRLCSVLISSHDSFSIH